MIRTKRIHAVKFVISRLWNFLNIYFLKPHDAINDTITAFLLTQFDWSGDFLEIGSGDGMFGYIMHGGSFPLSYDRYKLVDQSKRDIYNTHSSGVLSTTKQLRFPNIFVALDPKEAHVRKIEEINFAKNVLQARYETMPFAGSSFDNVFIYTPHELKDFGAMLDEVCRITRQKGYVYILVYDAAFKRAFMCKRLSDIFKGKLKDYFLKLDNGRFAELTGMAKSQNAWHGEFEARGLIVKNSCSGLSHLGWMAYDIQTRPILKPLIIFFGLLPDKARTCIKLVWLSLVFPYVLLALIVVFNFKKYHSTNNCYVAYQLQKL